MSWSNNMSQVSVGDEVYGSDGDKVGTVADVQASYLVVEKGFFFPTDYYIPFNAITQASNGQVMLNVTKDIALNSGWDMVPDVTATGVTQGETYVTETYATDMTGGATDLAGVTGQPEVAAYEATSEDELRIPVREEELTATVREREAGAVRIEKDVITEERTLNVPVTEEQVRVERRVVDRPISATDADAFQETVIDVPLTREEVELRKQARVAEEVVVNKEAVQHTEQVRGTVRREEVVVDEDAIVETTNREGLLDR